MDGFGKFVLVLVWAWVIIAFVSAIYFWKTRTDPSQPGIVRRGIGLGYGFIWPIVLVRYLIQKDRKAATSAEAAARILGDDAPSSGHGTSPSGTTSNGGPGRPITNPFDN